MTQLPLIDEGRNSAYNVILCIQYDSTTTITIITAAIKNNVPISPKQIWNLF